MRARRRLGQLELPGLLDVPPAPEENLWEKVDSLNARTEKSLRERRKLVKPKRRQVGLFEPGAPAPLDD